MSTHPSGSPETLRRRAAGIPTQNVPMARAKLLALADELSVLRQVRFANAIREIVASDMQRQYHPRPGAARVPAPAPAPAPAPEPLPAPEPTLTPEEIAEVRAVLVAYPNMTVSEVAVAWGLDEALVTDASKGCR